MSSSCENEVWKPAPNTAGYYSVSNLGRIRSEQGRKAGTIMAPQYHPKGYEISRFYVCGVRMSGKVHRVVAEAFIPNPENKPQINHKDGNKANNRVENLEWATNRENVRHAYANGLNKANNRKLTFLQAGQIRALYATNRFTTRELGVRFGISFVGVQNILNMRQYLAA